MYGSGPQLIRRVIRDGVATAPEYESGARPIRFGSFELHPNTGELRRRGMRIHVPRQAAQVLLMLLEKPGSVRGREELKRRLWPAGSYGDFDACLNKCIYTLRTALGDPVHSPLFIETVAGQGYRFIGPTYDAVTEQRLRSAPEWQEAPLAVLPFSVPEGDDELACLSDEITSQLIDEIGRIKELKVLAHSQTRNGAGAVNPKLLFSKFGVRAIIVGDLRRQQGDVSVHAEMADGITGIQLWGMHVRVSLETATRSPERIAEQVAQCVVQFRSAMVPEESSGTDS